MRRTATPPPPTGPAEPAKWKPIPPRLARVYAYTVARARELDALDDVAGILREAIPGAPDRAITDAAGRIVERLLPPLAPLAPLPSRRSLAAATAELAATVAHLGGTGVDKRAGSVGA